MGASPGGWHPQTISKYLSVKYLLILEVESSRTSLASRTSSRTHFEVLGLGLEASSPQKLACPRLEDSTIFERLKFRWKTPETSRKICKDLFLVSSSRDRPKKIFEDLFHLKKKFEDLFFWRTLAPVSLASRGSVLGRKLCILKSTSG